MSKWSRLVKSLRDSVCYDAPGRDTEYTNGFAEGIRSAAYQLDLLLAREPSPRRSKWHRVEDGLPPENEVVQAIQRFFWTQDHGWLPKDAYITHWRELPCFKEERDA